MSILIDHSPKRLFAFGCSFTEYYWPTWTEILSLDLDIPCYNYGKSGAGNQYIANMLVQADHFYKFNKDDLVIVSWTSVCREDRWKSRNWITPGNIFTQGDYDEAWVEKWADPVGYLVRDLATISLTKNYLENKKCNWHMFSMCDLTTQLDQQNQVVVDQNSKDCYIKLLDMYADDIGSINSSFFKVLWDNDIYKNKILKDLEKFSGKFSDGHPNVLEHLQYLQTVFPDHIFKETTLNSIERSYSAYTQFIEEQIKIKKSDFAIYMLESEQIKKLYNLTSINQPLTPQRI